MKELRQTNDIEVWLAILFEYHHNWAECAAFASASEAVDQSSNSDVSPRGRLFEHGGILFIIYTRYILHNAGQM